MSRRLKLLLLAPVAAAAALLLFGFGGRAADNPVLTADVGLDDGYTLTFVDASGAKVTHLDPGTYTINVRDHSTFHNFHLFGPGVNQSTAVADVTSVTWTVTFTDGKYTFQCDPHASVGMKGTFTVGNPPAAPPPTTKPSAAKLSAHVGPGASIGVTGTAGLGAGKATITVKDSSKSDNFHLVGPGLNKATGVGFRGTVKWTVTLRTGTYTFRSDKHKQLHGSFHVSAGTSQAANAGGVPNAGGGYGY